MLQVTACAFGGASLDQLFITTASCGISASAIATDAECNAGALFRLDLSGTSIRGVAAPCLKLLKQFYARSMVKIWLQLTTFTFLVHVWLSDLQTASWLKPNEVTMALASFFLFFDIADHMLTSFVRESKDRSKLSFKSYNDLTHSFKPVHIAVFETAPHAAPRFLCHIRQRVDELRALRATRDLVHGKYSLDRKLQV